MKDCFQKYPMMVVAAVFTAGIVAGSELFPTLSWLYAVLMMAVSLMLTFIVRRHNGWQTVFLLMAVFTVGISRMTLNDQHVSDYRQGYSEPMARRMIVGTMNELFDAQAASDEGGVVVAMTMGDKRDIHHDLRADYAASGAAHVLALSGLHIGIVFFLFRLLRGPRRSGRASWRFLLTEALIIAAIWTYVYIVGMPPSAVRAATMVSLYELMSLRTAERISLNVIGATAFVMLLAHPADAYKIGFQLSFAAVISIVLWYPLIYAILPKPTNRIIVWLWSMICVSTAAQIGVTPLLAYHFGYVSCYAVFSSLVVIPCATAIVSLSALLLMFLPVTSISSCIVAILAWVAGIMNKTVAWMATLPGSTIADIQLNRSQVVLIYLSLACACLACAHISKKSKMMNKTR